MKNKGIPEDGLGISKDILQLAALLNTKECLCQTALHDMKCAGNKQWSLQSSV